MNYIRSTAIIIISVFLGLATPIFAMQKGGQAVLRLTQKAKNTLVPGSVAMPSQRTQNKVNNPFSDRKNGLNSTFFPATASTSAYPQRPAILPDFTPMPPTPGEVTPAQVEEDENILEDVTAPEKDDPTSPRLRRTPEEQANDGTQIPENLVETAHEEGVKNWYQRADYAERDAQVRKRNKLKIAGGIIVPDLIKIKPVEKAQKPTTGKPSQLQNELTTPQNKNSAPTLSAKKQKNHKRVIVSPASPLSSVLPANPRAHMISYGQRVMPVIPVAPITQRITVQPTVQKISATPTPPTSLKLRRPGRGTPRKVNTEFVIPQQNSVNTRNVSVQNPSTLKSIQTSALPLTVSKISERNFVSNGTNQLNNPFPELNRILQRLHKAQTAHFVPVLIETELVHQLLKRTGTGFVYNPQTISSFTDIHGNTAAIFGKPIEGLTPCYVTQTIAEKLAHTMETIAQHNPNMLGDTTQNVRTLTYASASASAKATSDKTTRYTLYMPNTTTNTTSDFVKTLLVFTTNYEHATCVLNAIHDTPQQNLRPYFAEATKGRRPAPLAITQTQTNASSSALPKQAEIIVIKDAERGHTHSRENPYSKKNYQKKYDHTGHQEGNDRSHHGNNTNNSQGQQHNSHGYNYHYVPPISHLAHTPMIQRTEPMLPLARQQIIPGWLFDESNADKNVVIEPTPTLPEAPLVVPDAPPLIDYVDPNEQLIPDWLFQEKNENPVAPAIQPVTQPEEKKKAEPVNTQQEQQNEYDELDPAYAQNPYNDANSTHEAQARTLPENTALAQLPQPAPWPRNEEHPYMSAPYSAPTHGTQPANYNTGGGSGAPSYGGQYNVPAEKQQERTPYRDTVVHPYKNAFSVLTPSELAKKRKERMVQRGK